MSATAPEVGAIVSQVLAFALANAVPGHVQKGHELPAELARHDGRTVLVVLPVSWRWRGRIVQESDLSAIADAITDALQSRAETNRSYGPVANVRVVARRARPTEALRNVTVAFDSPVEAVPPPVEPGDVGARIRLGTHEFSLGEGRDSHAVSVPPGSVVAALDSGNLWLGPEKVCIHVGGAFHHELVRVEEGPFAVHATGWLGRFGRPGRLLVAGEVLQVVKRAPAAGFRVCGEGLDISLDAENLQGEVENAGAGLKMRFKPETGVLALQSGRSGSVTAHGPLGPILLDHAIEAETLAGEVSQVDIAGRSFFLTAIGEHVERACAKVFAVSPTYTGRFAPGAVFAVDRKAVGDAVLLVGELFRSPGVGALLRMRVPGHVDGRLAQINEVVPVRRDCSLIVHGTALHVRT